MQATGSLQGGPRSGCAEPRWPRTAPAAAAAAGRGAAVLHQPPRLRGARSPALAGAHRLAAAATTKATRVRVVPSAAAAARPGVQRSEPLVRVSGSEGIAALQERRPGKSRVAAAGRAASPLPRGLSHRGRGGKRAGEQAPQFALAAPVPKPGRWRWRLPPTRRRRRPRRSPRLPLPAARHGPQSESRTHGARAGPRWPQASDPATASSPATAAATAAAAATTAAAAASAPAAPAAPSAAAAPAAAAAATGLI